MFCQESGEITFLTCLVKNPRNDAVLSSCVLVCFDSASMQVTRSVVGEEVSRRMFGDFL